MGKTLTRPPLSVLIRINADQALQLWLLQVTSCLPLCVYKQRYIADPKCTGSGRLPGPTSNQYYECELIWFQWQPQLKTCPDGQIYDKTTAQCVGGSKSLSENVAVPEETIDVLKNLFSQIETMFS
mgnify:CR=1 FL=1